MYNDYSALQMNCCALNPTGCVDETTETQVT